MFLDSKLLRVLATRYCNRYSQSWWQSTLRTPLFCRSALRAPSPLPKQLALSPTPLRWSVNSGSTSSTSPLHDSGLTIATRPKDGNGHLKEYLRLGHADGGGEEHGSAVIAVLYSTAPLGGPQGSCNPTAESTPASDIEQCTTYGDAAPRIRHYHVSLHFVVTYKALG